MIVVTFFTTPIHAGIKKALPNNEDCFSDRFDDLQKSATTAAIHRERRSGILSAAHESVQRECLDVCLSESSEDEAEIPLAGFAFGREIL